MNNTRLYGGRTKLQMALAAAIVGCASGAAQAQNVGQCIKQTASCAGNIATTSLAALEAGGEILEFAARNPNCVADMISYNFVTIGISTSMLTLAATGVLKKDGNSYYKGVYGPAARPVIEKVSQVMPLPQLADLLENSSDAAIGAAFSGIAGSIPMPSAGAWNLDLQLQCGGAIAGAGMQIVGDVKRVIGHAKSAVKSCSAAAGCFKEALVGIVKDPIGAVGSAGEFVLDGADAVLDAILPSCKNPSVESYFAANFKPQVNKIAWELAWGDPNYYGPVSQYLVNTCVKFFDECNSDKDTAKRQCVVMSSGAVQTDGNGWIAGKGLEQLVRTRELELAIPRMLAVEARWVDNQQQMRVDNMMVKIWDDITPEAKGWLKPSVNTRASSLGFRAGAVRKILGVTRADGKFGVDEKVVLPTGSIGALMLGYVPVEGPKEGLGSYKAGQIYKKYYPESGNPKLLAQIDAEGAKEILNTKNQLIGINGENWNKEYAKLNADKIRARAAQCKNADKKCVDAISGNAFLIEVSLRGTGAVQNYAGAGLWGLQHPAHLKYKATFDEGWSAAGKSIVESQLVLMPSPGSNLNGTVPSTPAGPAAALTGTIAPQKPAMTQLPAPGAPGTPGAPGAPMPTVPQALPPPSARIGMPSVPGMQPSAAAPPSGGRIGMPSLPGMGGMAGSIPPSSQLNAGAVAAAAGSGPGKPGGTAVANTPPPVSSTPVVVPNAGNLGAAAGLVPPAPPPAPAPLVALSPAPPPTQQLNAAALAAAAQQAAAAAKPFDDKAYEKEREGVLIARWLPQCPPAGPCRQQIPVLASKQVDAEMASIKAGNPKHDNKVAVMLLQQQSDAKSEAQYRAALVPPAPPPPPPPPAPPPFTAMPDPAANIGNKPVTVPKGALLPKPFVK